MFLNSIFAGIKRGSSILGLATTVTSATVGSVTAYYLFKGDDTKEKLEKVNSELKEVQRAIEKAKIDIKGKGFQDRMGFVQKEVVLKARNKCYQDEMKRHDDNYTAFGSSYTPKIDDCKKRHFLPEDLKKEQ